MQWDRAHSPTRVTDITTVERATPWPPSLRSGEVNHRQSCDMTRPVSIPWINRLAIPGPITSAKLCGGCSIGMVELDIVVQLPSRRRGGRGRKNRKCSYVCTRVCCQRTKSVGLDYRGLLCGWRWHALHQLRSTGAINDGGGCLTLGGSSQTELELYSYHRGDVSTRAEFFFSKSTEMNRAENKWH